MEGEKAMERIRERQERDLREYERTHPYGDGQTPSGKFLPTRAKKRRPGQKTPLGGDGARISGRLGRSKKKKYEGTNWISGRGPFLCRLYLHDRANQIEIHES
jgi:hypothetical protein